MIRLASAGVPPLVTRFNEAYDTAMPSPTERATPFDNLNVTGIGSVTNEASAITSDGGGDTTLVTVPKALARANDSLADAEFSAPHFLDVRPLPSDGLVGNDTFKRLDPVSNLEAPTADLLIL